MQKWDLQGQSREISNLISNDTSHSSGLTKFLACKRWLTKTIKAVNYRNLCQCQSLYFGGKGSECTYERCKCCENNLRNNVRWSLSLCNSRRWSTDRPPNLWFFKKLVAEWDICNPIDNCQQKIPYFFLLKPSERLFAKRLAMAKLASPLHFLSSAIAT